MLGRTRHVHFVGIGGVGMSGIAELLANLGYVVSGSDINRSELTEHLVVSCGVIVHEGHAADNVVGADVVVFSSAVKATNLEILEAKRLEIPVVPRAEILAELMRLKFSIGVAGTHGKTTTTSMIALVLDRAGLDPTAVIGGRLSAFGGNTRLGSGKYMVAEADESDRSFLLLWPSIAVITNIDHEHLERYGSFTELQQAFVDFANKVPFYGAVVVCADDAGLMGLAKSMRRRVVSYGLSSNEANFLAINSETISFGMRCLVQKRRRAGDQITLGELQLPVPGLHNLRNALATVAVADEIGIDFSTTAEALAEFHGVDRRFQRYDEQGSITIIDDYGHHPTELSAVLETARSVFARRLVVVFQPHRFTRTHQLIDQFGPALANADEIILTDIYPAGEDPIPGVTIDLLANSLRRDGLRVKIARELDEVVPMVLDIAQPGDVVMTLGAGSISRVPARLIEALRKEERLH